MSRPCLTTRSLKHAGLFESRERANRARESYIADARVLYGKRVWHDRYPQAPVYHGSEGGWVVPVLLASGRTVYLTGVDL